MAPLPPPPERQRPGLPGCEIRARLRAAHPVPSFPHGSRTPRAGSQRDEALPPRGRPGAALQLQPRPFPRRVPVHRARTSPRAACNLGVRSREEARPRAGGAADGSPGRAGFVRAQPRPGRFPHSHRGRGPQASARSHSAGCCGAPRGSATCSPRRPHGFPCAPNAARPEVRPRQPRRPLLGPAPGSRRG